MSDPIMPTEIWILPRLVITVLALVALGVTNLVQTSRR